MHEVRDADSDLLSVHLPAARASASAAAAAVSHEFSDPASRLRAGVLAPIAAELAHPTVAGIGGGLAHGVSALGQGTRDALVGGADLAGKGVRLVAAGAGRLLGAAAGPPVAISPATRARLDNARLMTRTVVVVAHGLVQGAATMAASLGASAAGALGGSSVGAALAAGGESEAGRAVCRVAAASVGAVGAVWEGLETAACTLGGHVGGAASELVGARYGAEAAAATAQGIAVVGDLGEATLLSGMHLTPVTLLAQGVGSATIVATSAVEAHALEAAHAGAAGGGGGAEAAKAAAPAAAAPAEAVVAAPAPAPAAAAAAPAAAPAAPAAAEEPAKAHAESEAAFSVD